MFEYFSHRKVPDKCLAGCKCRKCNISKNGIDSLRKIKSKIRFISFEPLIGPVGEVNLKEIHWAIVGGESGRSARPIKKEWIEEIFRQCKKQDVAFFFKQWGTWGADEIKRNKKANGRIFRGRVWNEFPKELKYHNSYPE